MEANLFIKSYRMEGDKVKDIDFYGDWVIDAGSAELVPNYIETRPLDGDLFPYGITLERSSEPYQTTGTKHIYTIKNKSPWTYYISNNASTQKFELPPNKNLVVTQTVTGTTAATIMTARIFSADKKHCVGIIQLTQTV